MTDIRTAAETVSRAQLAFDNPEAYIAGDRRRALAAGIELPDRVQGAALFADVSGFTQLTEALAAELGPQRGAEELTACLNLVFHSVISELDRFGGDVIYFSGDAITCWLDGDDGSRATACALAMQETMEVIGEEIAAGSAGVRLAMKVAVAVGDARRFVVGDPEIQLIDVLAGRLIDDLAAAERQAQQGEVVLDESVLVSLGGRVEIGERRTDPEGGRTVGVVTRLHDPPAELPVAAEGRLPEEVVREWILPAVYERLRTGRGEFLAELRPAVALFVQFGGIDYDADDADREARRLRPPCAADLLGVRRQRAPAHDRRQGRLPLQRLRLAACARGRRCTRRGRRARAENARPGHGRRRSADRPRLRAASAAARMATRCGAPSSASAMRSISPRG